MCVKHLIFFPLLPPVRALLILPCPTQVIFLKSQESDWKVWQLVGEDGGGRGQREGEVRALPTLGNILQAGVSLKGRGTLLGL